jgi:hypothetical protein
MGLRERKIQKMLQGYLFMKQETKISRELEKVEERLKEFSAV